MKRCKGVKVTHHTTKIQDFDEEFYEQFHVIIAGLDNIEARRWLNSMLHSMVKFDEDAKPDITTVKPLIDGGTEGFKGQARLIMPFISGCFECSLGSLPPQQNYPMCTIAETPRLPEHCIQYAYVVMWEKEFGSKAVDKDSPVDMQWIFEKAEARGKQFGIEGVTYQLTMGVVKNIIPAIASTNALISASCVNEALKVATYCSKSVENYSMYMGQTGLHMHTFMYERNPECVVCSNNMKTKEIKKTTTLKELLDLLQEEYQLKGPQISNGNGDTLYIPKPPALEEKYHANLDKTID